MGKGLAVLATYQVGEWSLVYGMPKDTNPGPKQEAAAASGPTPILE